MIKIEITGEAMTDEFAMPAMTMTLLMEEVSTVEELEGLFRRTAYLLGFEYVGRIEFRKQSILHVEGDEVGKWNRTKMEDLLKSNKEEEIV